MMHGIKTDRNNHSSQHVRSMLRRKNKTKNNSPDKKGFEMINDDLCAVLQNSPIKITSDKYKDVTKKIENNLS